jgi:hypothetical protein
MYLNRPHQHKNEMSSNHIITVLSPFSVQRGNASLDAVDIAFEYDANDIANELDNDDHIQCFVKSFRNTLQEQLSKAILNTAVHCSLNQTTAVIEFGQFQPMVGTLRVRRIEYKFIPLGTTASSTTISTDMSDLVQNFSDTLFGGVYALLNKPIPSGGVLAKK